MQLSPMKTLRQPEILSDPYPYYELLRKEGPLIRDASGAWIVTHYAAILEVLTARFTKVPEEIASALQRLEALDRLHGLLRQAVRCPTIAALQEMLHTA